MNEKTRNGYMLIEDFNVYVVETTAVMMKGRPRSGIFTELTREVALRLEKTHYPQVLEIRIGGDKRNVDRVAQAIRRYCDRAMPDMKLFTRSATDLGLLYVSNKGKKGK